MKRIRTLGTATVCGTVLAASLGAALFSAPAGATKKHKPKPVVKVKEFVHASTTLAKLQQTVAIPTGKLSGTLNPLTGALKANLALPPASSTIALAGIGLVTATFSVVPTKPVVGTIDFTKSTITTTSVFNIAVDSLEPQGTSVNLVGTTCQSSVPITLTLTGAFALIGPSTFSSDYTIPKFAHCGLATVALNQAVAGSGNGFTALFSPFS
jgi:hypothetical protein